MKRKEWKATIIAGLILSIILFATYRISIPAKTIKEDIFFSLFAGAMAPLGWYFGYLTSKYFIKNN